MNSLLASTKNTRFLIENSFRYIRSDVPDHLSEDERAWLLENNLRTIIDLRSAREREERPCSLEQESDFTYYAMPVTDGDRIPESPELVSRSYIDMVDDKMWKIIHTIETAKTNVMYFCTVGKDRTGVVSAILLSRMKVDRDQIVDNYVLSAEYLKDVIQAFAMSSPSIDIKVITPHREYMEQFLDEITQREEFQ